MNQLAFNPSFHPGSFETGTLADFAPVHQQQVYHIDAAQNQAFAYPGQYHDGVNSHALQRPAGDQATGGRRMMQPAHVDQQPSATYLQTVPAQAAQTPTPPTRQPASLPQHLPPHHAASHPKSNSLTPPSTTYPMAAPPLSQSPATSQQQQPNNTATTPPTPQSPATTNREQSRIALLLSINQDLLVEINRLQSLSQGGAVNPQQAAQLRNAGQSDKMASEDYIQLLRRVQGNLAYLMPRAGNQNNETGAGPKVLPGPAFMQHPPQMPVLREKYERLRKLFPDWVGNDAKLMAMSSSGSAGGGSPAQQQQGQQQQQQSANGVPTSTS